VKKEKKQPTKAKAHALKKKKIAAKNDEHKVIADKVAKVQKKYKNKLTKE
jgi:hypothetical protein